MIPFLIVLAAAGAVLAAGILLWQFCRRMDESGYPDNDNYNGWGSE